MNNDTNERYRRHLILDEIGGVGQEKLKNSSVFVAGAGGLGSPVLYYLAAVGVGRIGICDGDTVSVTNLNRQILYKQSDVGKSKAILAKERLSALNPTLRYDTYPLMLDEENSAHLIQGYDVLAFCLDSFKARSTLNKAAVAQSVPYVEGAVREFTGSVISIVPGVTPCYECIYGISGSNITTENIVTPILGSMAGIVGSMMAIALTRLLTGVRDPSFGTILLIDGKNHSIDHIELKRNQFCPVCG